MFLIYNNNFTEGVTTNPEPFEDDASLFSVVHDTQTAAKNFHKYFGIIDNCTFQWKMKSNPDPIKQSKEVIFSCKAKEINHPLLAFNNSSVSQSSFQKQLYVICKAFVRHHLDYDDILYD